MRVIFTTSPHLSSRLIRQFDDSPASHVGMSIDDGATVIDATWSHGGVRAWPLHTFCKMDQRRVVTDLVIDLPREREAAAFLRAQIGKPYDWSALLGMALWGDWSDPGRWFCFELLVATMNAGGIRIPTGLRRVPGRLALELATAHARFAKVGFT